MLKCILLVTTFATLSKAAPNENGSKYITDWNKLVLNQIVATGANSNLATRALAIVHVAQYEAVDRVLQNEGLKWSSTAAGLESIQPSLINAIAAAGKTALLGTGVLSGVNTTAVNALYDSQVQNSAISALDLGVQRAQATVANNQTDGASPAPPPFYGGSSNTTKGSWRPTPPTFTAALTPQWANVRSWAIPSPSQYRVLPPPALDSAAYEKSYNEVRTIGNATSSVRTSEQTDIANFWRGNVEVYWFQVVQQAAEQSETLLSAVQYYAASAVAAADARIAAWDSKYYYLNWRPVTAIPLGNSVSYPADPSFKSVFATPPHPEYPSGHTSTGAAVAETLALLTGQNDFNFSISSYTLNGATRSYSSFSQANLECANSRVLGGVHYRFANVASAAQGILVGRDAYRLLFNAQDAFGGKRSIEKSLPDYAVPLVLR